LDPFELVTTWRVTNAQMLSVLYDRGPLSNGLFRRSASYAKCQSARVTLDTGRQFNFDEAPLAVTAALLKVTDSSDGILRYYTRILV